MRGLGRLIRMLRIAVTIGKAITPKPLWDALRRVMKPPLPTINQLADQDVSRPHRSAQHAIPAR